MRLVAVLTMAFAILALLPSSNAWAAVLEGDAGGGATAPPASRPTTDGDDGSGPLIDPVLSGGVPVGEEQTYENAGEESTGAMQSWIGTGAAHALAWSLRKLDPGAPQLLGSQSPSGTWFTEQYAVMRAMGIWVMVPLLLIAIIYAITKGSMEMLVKSVLVYMPLSVLGSVVAVELVDQLLSITDDIAAVFADQIGQNSTAYWEGVMASFSGDDDEIVLNVIIAMAMIAVSVTMWVILVMREASIYIASAFLPIGFAMLVWPTTAKYFRKLCEFLFAMIFSKVIIVAGVSLAIAGVAGSVDEPRNTTGLDGGQVQPVASVRSADSGNALNDVGSVLEGEEDTSMTFRKLHAIVMLGIISFAPVVLTRMVGNVGFDGASGALNEMLNRPGLASQAVAFNRVHGTVTAARGTAHNVHSLPARLRDARGISANDVSLQTMGAVRRSYAGGTSNYHISEAEFLQAGIANPADAKALAALSESDNPDAVAAAHTALRLGVMYDGMDVGDGYTSVYRKNAHGGRAESVGLIHMVDSQGRRLRHIEPSLIRHIADEERAKNAAAGNANASVRILSPLDVHNPRQTRNISALSKAGERYRLNNGVANVRVMFDGNLNRTV